MKILVSIALLGAFCLMPIQAQNLSKLTFNIGGGPTTPLNPTARYTGVSGNFVAGAGYNLNKHNSISGEFMWAGLPPNLFVFKPIGAPFGNINLYALTAQYRWHHDKLAGPLGAYLIAGGGWYYRHTSVDQNYVVPDGTVCQPIYTFWGYGCTPEGFVYTATIASRGSSAGGVNAGVGFTLRLTDNGWKFFVESRYHYAWNGPLIPSTLVPVTFGFRFN
jgi:hypothetical protein